MAIIGCDTNPGPSPAEGGANNSSAKLPEASIPDAGVGAPVAKLEQAGARFTTNPKTKRPNAVDLSAVLLTDELAAELSQLSSLSQLTLQATELTDQGWRELVKLNQLQHLDLRQCSIGDAQLLQLTSGLTKLRSLRLNGQTEGVAVTDAGLAGLKSLTDLKLLALDGVPVTAAGMAGLSSCPELAELYLAGTKLDDSAGEVLSDLVALRKLRLARTAIGAAVLEGIGELSLEDLDLSECPNVDDRCCEMIARMKSLRRLNLWSDRVTDAALPHLGQLVQLQWLNLDNTQIGDDSLSKLASLSELSFLHLGSTKVSDQGLKSLVALKGLKKLVVTRTDVTAAGVAAFQMENPQVEVQLQYVPGQ